MSRNDTFRRLGAFAGLAVLGAYMLFTLRGQHGVGAWQNQQKEIRTVQEQNAELRREIVELQDRNRRLRENPEEQDLEVRRRLNLLKKGEKRFVVPEKTK
ncbi:MAG: septum formation initiator family protein [Bryobacterales bacterium]|nr:septum formation initiator family protein [Bryobacterales bacterium]